MAGWIKIFNKFLQWEWFDIAEMVQLFLYLLLNANYKDVVWRGVVVKRGQLITSRDKIGKDLRLTERQVRTCLSRLKATGEISIKATNKYSIITICKYDEYQNEDCNSRPAERPAERPTTDQQPTDKTTSEATTSTEEQNNRSKEYNIKDIKQESGSNDQLSSASNEAKAVQPEKPKTEKLPFKEIKEMWNETCPGFPKLFTISEARKNKMRLRIVEMGGVEKALLLLKQIFTKMQQSNFLKGDNKRGWKASFDWLFENDKNWVKVYEGNYDNKPEQTVATRYGNNKNCNDEWK